MAPSPVERAAFRGHRAAAQITFALFFAMAGSASAMPGAVADRHPPGAAPWAAAEAAAVARAWSASIAADAETRLRRPDGSPRYVNRLLLESSPYLREHAFNPVDWRPWGDEAFAEAQRLRRPVFLSIGYSTCHWCHVMAAESFEDEAIARLLNERYVAIKVDREERPDVDATYLAALDALGSSGGWPMSLWLTPAREPFFGGTYIPARDGDRGQSTGLLTLLTRLADGYAADPQHAASTGGMVRAMLQAKPAVSALGSPGAPAPPAFSWIDAAVAAARERFDPAHGGQRGAPKFPSDLPLRLLLRQSRRTGDAASLDMVRVTLRAMAAGALQDQAGGGFHRYATDEAWRVPHFEKTLYDNAQLAVTYLEAFQAGADPEFRAVARRTLDAVLRDLSNADGGFAGASDADSLADPRTKEAGQRREGAYFTWTRPELDAALAGLATPRRLDLAPAGEIPGRSALVLGRAPTDEAGRRALDEERRRLFAARATRSAPALDDKEITAWNGLMIGALARAALALDEPAYVERARRAADAMLARRAATRDALPGRLPRSARAGRRGPPAVLDDYAFLIAGLLDLYEATGELRWFTAAQDLDRTVAERFADPAGGFFFTADDVATPLLRRSLWSDGAEPSGNAVMALDLLRLAAFTGDDGYRSRAARLLAAAAAAVAESPGEHGELLLAVDFLLASPLEIVIVTPRTRAEAAPFLDRLRGRFLPARVLSVHSVAELSGAAARIPLLAGRGALGGKCTAYVCRGFVCDRPTSDPEVFAGQLSRLGSPAPGPVSSH